MLDKVLDTIEKHRLIEYGEGIVVGLSGGPDSVCLLHVLKNLSGRLGAKIFAVHVNHMLRGDEADADEEYCRELCRSLGIPFYSEKCDVAALAEKEGISVEEAGRIARYSIFEKYADRLGADKIAVAHNRNDQAETVLLNIIRGTGIDGLKGMDYVRGRIIRPLLDADRSEIEAYCRENNLDTRTDRSNLESVYTRNRIRLELIPFLKENFNPSIVESLVRLAGNVREDAAFLNDKAYELYISCRLGDGRGMEHEGKGCSSIKLDAKRLGELSGAMAGRVVRFAIRDIKGDLDGIENVHVRDILKLCKGRTGTELHLPGGIRARFAYGGLEIFSAAFEKGGEIGEIDVKVRVPGKTEVADAGWIVETSVLLPKDIERCNDMGYNSLVQFFDYEKLDREIHLRNRRDGDVFKPLKGNGTKKLKKFFNEMKIPRHERDRIPLIATGNEIVWVVGHKISDKYKVTENTKTVLSIRFMQG